MRVRLIQDTHYFVVFLYVYNIIVKMLTPLNIIIISNSISFFFCEFTCFKEMKRYAFNLNTVAL